MQTIHTTLFRSLPWLSKALSLGESPMRVSKGPYADTGAKMDQGISDWPDAPASSLGETC